jgi:hypothetical protein
MTRVRDFVADLAKTGKSFKEIKEIVDSVYGDKTLKKTAIYAILKKVKAGERPLIRGISIRKREHGFLMSSPLSPPP